MLTDLRTVTFDEVFHVGTLDPAERQSSSYEGDGLSVSVHPDEWAQIARCGGPTWVLRKPHWEPFRFASYLDLDESDRDLLRDWAAGQGWIEQRTVFRVSWEDEDWNDTVSMDCNTEAEATAEAEARDEDEGLDTTVAPVLAWRPTATFPEGRIATDIDPTDALLALWVRTNRPDLDGVWWDEEFAPDLLSAPRGVLVHDLSTYSRHEVS